MKKNRKKIIIILCVVIILIIFGLFLIFGRENEKSFKENVTINCSFSTKLKFMHFIINLKANYEDDIFLSTQETYEIKLIDEKLIEKADEIKNLYDKKFLEAFGENDVDYSIERNDNSIFIRINADSEIYENMNDEAKEIAGDTSINHSQYFYGHENLHEYIKTLGGDCQYE